jgi:1,2-diacylglycerol 3-beta-galactosyltransferase
VEEATARAEAPKKVLILMSDTGDEHRASAEAIRCGLATIFYDNNLHTIAHVAL